MHDLADNAARRVVSPQRSGNGQPAQLITGSFGDSARGIGVSELWRPARQRTAAGERAERARELAGRLRAELARAAAWPGARSPSGELIPDEVVGWLRGLVHDQVLSDVYEHELARRMGPDVFGLLTLPAAPAFLAAADPAALAPEHVAPFLRAISMTRPAPSPADLTPAALATSPGPVSRHHRTPAQQHWEQPPGAPQLPADTVIPHIIHGIWLGGPIPPHAAIRTNFAAAARRYAGHADIAVWTDIPRAAFTAAETTPPAPPGAPDPHAATRSMLTWARDHGIHLINVHEVFHAAAPMNLHAQYTAEINKQLPRGYAGASDHLRLDIIYRFGGLYLDGDNHLGTTPTGHPLPGTPAALLDAVAASPHGFVPHVLPGGVNNDLIIAPARHPAILLWTELGRAQYRLTQPDLYSGLPVMNLHYVGHELGLLRYSLVLRSGRIHHQLLAALKLPLDDRRLVRADQVVSAASELSWSQTTAPLPPVPPTPAQVTTTLTRVITTLARQLITREGNLHLTAVAPVITALPDPDAAWTATLTILAELTAAGTTPAATSITQFRWADDGTPQHTTLPPEAEALLDRTITPANWLGASLAAPGQPAWLLDEATTPAGLRTRPRPGLRPARLRALTRTLTTPDGTITGLQIPATPGPLPATPHLPGHATIHLHTPHGHPLAAGHPITPEDLALLLHHHRLHQQPLLLATPGHDPATLTTLARHLHHLLHQPIHTTLTTPAPAHPAGVR